MYSSLLQLLLQVHYVHEPMTSFSNFLQKPIAAFHDEELETLEGKEKGA